MSRKEIILFALMQLFFIATIFPYNDILTGIVIGGMMLCCILFNGFKEKFALLKTRRYIIWMILYFAWIFFSIFFSKDQYEGFRALDPRLPLFYFPVTIGLIKISKEFKERLFLGFAIITTLFCAICLIWSVNNYIKSGNVDYLYGDAISALADQQAIYISLLVNFSIYIFCLFIFFRSVKFKSLLVIALAFLFVASFMLASRNMLVVLYTSVIGFSIYYVFKSKKFIPGITIAVIFILGAIAVVKFFPKTLNRFTDFLYTQYDYQHEGTESNLTKETTPDQWNGANFRLAAWRCGWEIFKAHPITGVHLGDKRGKLTEKYKEKNFLFAIRTNKNVHNNYLDVLFGSGIIGFILFLTGWFVLPFRSALIGKDYLSLLMIITFAIATITEVYLDRSLGGMLFGFFIPLILTDKNT
ncbi:MAG: O-antigen ligase family protein [Chitinophagaceae bacterium]